MPERIQFNRFNGEPLPLGARLVTRPGRFGNPFKGPFAAEEFARYIAERGTLTGRIVYAAIQYPSDEEIRTALAGCDLACACRPPTLGEPDLCHAATLLAIANPKEVDHG